MCIPNPFLVSLIDNHDVPCSVCAFAFIGDVCPRHALPPCIHIRRTRDDKCPCGGGKWRRDGAAESDVVAVERPVETTDETGGDEARERACAWGETTWFSTCDSQCVILCDSVWFCVWWVCVDVWNVPLRPRTKQAVMKLESEPVNSMSAFLLLSFC